MRYAPIRVHEAAVKGCPSRTCPSTAHEGIPLLYVVEAVAILAGRI